eukprot:1480660-Pyramimonas_sp.AAC.1
MYYPRRCSQLHCHMPSHEGAAPGDQLHSLPPPFQTRRRREGGEGGGRGEGGGKEEEGGRNRRRKRTINIPKDEDEVSQNVVRTMRTYMQTDNRAMIVGTEQ